MSDQCPAAPCASRWGNLPSDRSGLSYRRDVRVHITVVTPRIRSAGPDERRRAVNRRGRREIRVPGRRSRRSLAPSPRAGPGMHHRDVAIPPSVSTSPFASLLTHQHYHRRVRNAAFVARGRGVGERERVSFDNSVR